MILMMRERRDLARQRVEAYHKERKLQAIASHEDEKKKCKDILERKEKELIKDIDKVWFIYIRKLTISTLVLLESCREYFYILVVVKVFSLFNFTLMFICSR